jgi:AcrR family transcriptional regulator
MPPSESTRDRILSAAKKELARHGVAGARIDRIATNARTSKERIYAHFPSKEALFAAVTDQLVVDVAEATALRGDDVPGYVGRVIDHLVAHLDDARLTSWLSLEPNPHLQYTDTEDEVLGTKLAEIAKGQAAGDIDPHWDPLELLVVITALARAIAIPGRVELALVNGRRGPVAHEALRGAAVEAARRIIAAPPGD